MNCAECREEILERMDAGAVLDGEPAGHVAECAECAEFLEEQRAVDAWLMAELRAPELPAGLGGRVRAEVRRERRGRVARMVPEMVLLAGGAAASVLCAALLPLPRMEVAVVGFALTAAAYLLETAVLAALEPE